MTILTVMNMYGETSSERTKSKHFDTKMQVYYLLALVASKLKMLKLPGRMRVKRKICKDFRITGS